MANTKDIEVLHNDNYYSWRRNMEFLLQSKGLWGYVSSPLIISETISLSEERIPPPSTPVKGSDPGKGKDKKKTEDGDWFIGDAKARGLIGLYVHSDLQPVIEYCESAFNTWWALNEHFQLIAKSSKIFLQVQLFKAEMKSGESLLQFLNSIIRIRNNLRGLGMVLDEFMVCCKVISSLSSQYTTIAQSLMQTPDANLTLTYLRAQFALEESRSKLSGNGGSGNGEKQKNFQADGKDKDLSKIKCFRCGKMGHKADTCHVKIPHLDNGRGRGYGRGNGRGRGRGAGRGRGNKQDANEAEGKAISFTITTSEIYSENSEILENNLNNSYEHGKIFSEDPVEEDWSYETSCSSSGSTVDTEDEENDYSKYGNYLNFSKQVRKGTTNYGKIDAEDLRQMDELWGECDAYVYESSIPIENKGLTIKGVKCHALHSAPYKEIFEEIDDIELEYNYGEFSDDELNSMTSIDYDYEYFTQFGNCYAENTRAISSEISKYGNIWYRTQNEAEIVVYLGMPMTIRGESVVPRNDTFFGEFILLGSTDKHKTGPDINWYLDSGCTQHMTNNPDCVHDKIPQNIEVSGAIDGKSVIAKVSGTVQLYPIVDNCVKLLKLENVLAVPEIRKNLISVKQICARGGRVEFFENFSTVSYSGNIVMIAQLGRNGLFRVILNSTKAEIHHTSIDLWHERLGHLSETEMKKLLNSNMLVGMDFKPGDHLSFCPVCSSAKQVRTPFQQHSTITSTAVGDLIHSDVCGPIDPPALTGGRYFLTFIDDFSRKSWIYFLEKKSEVFDKFKSFRIFIQNQSDKHIKHLHSDGGGEYISGEFENFLDDNGIIHTITTANTPQKNGVAERLNRTLMDKARALLFSKNMDKVFWAQAVDTANFLRNRSPTKKLKDMTPEERFSGKKPVAISLKIFGSDCHYTITDRKKKLDYRARHGIFVGYDVKHMAYRIWDDEREKFIISRDVKFNEERLPSQKLIASRSEYFSYASDKFNNDSSEDADTGKSVPEVRKFTWDSDSDEDSVDEKSTVKEESAEGGKEIKTEIEKPQSEKEKDKGKDKDKSPDTSPTESKKKETKTAPTRRSTRNREQPKEYWDSSKILMVQIGDEPETWKEMLDSPQKSLWMKAAQEEYDSLIKMKTWILVEPKLGISVIKNRWIFKIKVDSEGNVDRYKARLVAKGYSQKEGIDYKETFSPVVRFETLRLLFSIASANSWTIQQMDVKVAFLNGELTEEIYMEQPEGFFEQPNLVCKLQKSLYGLKQSPRCWNIKFCEYMAKLKFIQSTADPCLFILRYKDDIVLVALYVDDLVITGNEQLVRKTKNYLNKQFEMKDLGDIKYILGILVERDQEGLYLSQSRYIEKVLERFNMSDCKKIATPAITPNSEESEKLGNEVPYKAAIGSLNFIATRTRPDISYAVGHVARHMHSPTKNDWIAVKRIFRYLQATKNLRLKFSAEHSELIGYSDASYAPMADDRKSTSGYIFISNGPISWKSKKQSIVALSSMEAEYIALCEAAKEGIWLFHLIKDIFPEDNSKLILLEDNQATIKTAKNEIISDRSKHIDVRYHFIRQHVMDGDIILNYCQTNVMVADALTKALDRIKLEQHVAAMRLL
jgi:hypothetical protein